MVIKGGIKTIDFEGAEIQCCEDMENFFCVSEFFADEVLVTNGVFIFDTRKGAKNE
jgi:hypothetical protein